MSKIPFLDLVTPHVELEAELTDVFHRALRTAGFIGGPEVDQFEREFADFCDARYAVAVSSGTDALRFALTAAGVRSGHTVITVPNTFIATTEAISQAGATPDFVDVDDRTYTLSPEKLRAYLDDRCTTDPATGRLLNQKTGRPVTAVVPVHLYGQMADMDPILELCAQYRIAVVEDACQAHGAEYFSRKEQKWRKAGSMGHSAAFSFYPGKNLGACGEAGAVTTSDEAAAKLCRMLRDHGQSKKYYHDIEGYNGRLDAIQAGILRVKLRHLAKWNEQRRACAANYDKLFVTAGADMPIPYVPEWSRPVYHLYVVRVINREQVQKDLDNDGVGSGIHYPVPLHMSKPYVGLGFGAGDFPATEQAAAEVLSLPMFPNLKPDAQARVASAVLRAVAQKAQVTE